jgi:hypothetical protein
VRNAGSSFITTFWCGPPLDRFDDDRAAQIAAAGFSVVGAPCEGPMTPELNRRALDVAARHGLSMWIRDSRYDEQAPTRPDWEAALDAAVADYASHPGFGGFFVTDEPSTALFGNLARVAARLHASSSKPAYINLLANYVGPLADGTAYRDHVEQFVATVQPRLLSYDYYPFETTGDRTTFFSNLALIRDAAMRHDVPFMLILLAMPHANYRDPTEGEVSWQVFHAMAYGARGISYFAYWTPVDVEFQSIMQFRHGLIENGVETRHYGEAARVNRAARAIAGELASFRSTAVGDSLGQVAAALPLGKVERVEGGPVTAGLFTADGRQAMLLVNRDYQNPIDVSVRVHAGEAAPERFDVDSGRWHGGGGPVHLAAGGAQLLRWTR